MGICMDTGRNGTLHGQEPGDGQSVYFGSWPKQLNNNNSNSNGSIRYQRVQQVRTMSEPIIAVSAVQKADRNGTESSSSGPGPPRRVTINLRRKIDPVNAGEIPDVPIIFVLGGPGSGKITHCDRLAILDERLAHVNMQTTFLETAAEIGSRDPNSVPAYKALEQLIARLSKMRDAQAFVITGYPRNMRDVVEYVARIQRVDGVVLLDWSDRSLERQIQLGAKTGNVDINLARIEMNNYRSNIIPVAQFFDQQGHLHIVAGQRQPNEIFDDLGEEINGILSHTLETPLSIDAVQQNGEAEVQDGAVLEETQAVVHTSAESHAHKRKQSIDSVDLMIAEEIRNIIDEPVATVDGRTSAKNVEVAS